MQWIKLWPDRGCSREEYGSTYTQITFGTMILRSPLRFKLGAVSDGMFIVDEILYRGDVIPMI